MPKGQWIKIKQYKQAKIKVQQNSSQSLEDTKKFVTKLHNLFKITLKYD